MVVGEIFTASFSSALICAAREHKALAFIHKPGTLIFRMKHTKAMTRPAFYLLNTTLLGEVDIEEAVDQSNKKADLLGKMANLNDEQAFGEPSCVSSVDIDEQYQSNKKDDQKDDKENNLWIYSRYWFLYLFYLICN